MANQTRKRADFITGTIDNNPLTNSGTTLTSDELIALPAVDSSEHMVIILDPTGLGNGPEVVWVTAHTAGTSTATIVRGREGSSGVQHTSVRIWAHAPTLNDFPLDVTAATRPSGGGIPYQGQHIYETDTDEVLYYNGVNWRRPWKMPWGIVDYAEVTANQANLGTASDLTSLTITFTPVANRRYRIFGEIIMGATGGGGQGNLNLLKDGTQVQTATHSFSIAGESEKMQVTKIDTPTATSHVYKLNAGKNAFNADLAAAATFPAFIVVEDIGPNGAAT